MGIDARRNIAFSILSREKIGRIHEAALQLMQRVGMQMGGDRSLKLLKESGCDVSGSGLVKIPRSLLDWALKTVPKTLRLYNRFGQLSMTIDDTHPVYFGCHADMLEIVDPFTGQVRPFLKADTALMCQIADALANIHFVLSVGLSKDVSPEIQSQISFIETVKHFSKTINFSTNDTQSLQEVIDIAAVVAGGHSQLQEKPFIFNYCEPIPPLNHPKESTEKLFISAKNRIPVVYMPYCMMGGTAPMSFAATLAQCHAEVLSGLVLSQLVNEGTPFIYGAMPSILDMKSTIGSYGAVEFHLLVAAASELATDLNLPFYGTAGCTDAKDMDAQAVAEATMEIFSTLLSRANLVHDIGVSDHCKSVNPALVVLCDELIEMLKHYSQGVVVNDESLALDLIEKVGPAGAYLTQAHTMNHFRQVFYPTLFSRKMDHPPQSEVGEKIRRRIQDIVARPCTASLDEAICAELNSWTARLEAR